MAEPVEELGHLDCRRRLARPVIPQHEYLIPVEVCGHIPGGHGGPL